jgi:hypothetical protein
LTIVPLSSASHFPAFQERKPINGFGIAFYLAFGRVELDHFDPFLSVVAFQEHKPLKGAAL